MAQGKGVFFYPTSFPDSVRELISIIISCKVGCNIGQILYNVLAYADDMVLLAPSWHALQDLINVLHDESVLLDMKCNTDKTCCMVFFKLNTTVHNRQYLPCLKPENTLLNYVMSFKYLDHIIKNRLTNNDDIKREIQNLYIRCNILFRKYQKCSISVKINLFEAFCMCTYGCGRIF